MHALGTAAAALILFAGCVAGPKLVSDHEETYRLAFRADPPPTLRIENSATFYYSVNSFTPPHWELELDVPPGWVEAYTERVGMRIVEAGLGEEIRESGRTDWFAPGEASQYEIWQQYPSMIPNVSLLVDLQRSGPHGAHLFVMQR